MGKHNKEWGKVGFSKEYWDKNYSEPQDMDNIGNAREHARYIQTLFHLEQIEINSVIDYGFGLGYLFEEVLKIFNPYRACAIEPSEHAFLTAKERIKKPEYVAKLKLENTDLLSFTQKAKANEKAYDLGICTSVFQYLTDEEIEKIVPVLSRQVKYLYFSCPTDKEFKRQKEEYDFFDEYAIHRKKEKYLKWLRPHFTFVSSRMLESKHFFSDENSEFREQIFRF